jgi:hypothetical protein
MTLEASVLGDNAVRATAKGYEVDLHLAWYRSLPLSCVENLSVTIAGRTAARDELRVHHDGKKLTLDELANIVDDEWFVQDALTISVPDPAPVKRGSEADVEVTMATRIPYIIIGPDKALVKPTRVRRKVVVK